MVTRRDAEKALTDLMATSELRRKTCSGLLGDGAGIVVDPDNPDKNFVRIHGLQGSVASVFNKVVPTNRPNLPVLVGTTHEQPNLVQIIGVDWSALPEWEGATLLLLHGPEHEVPGGPDPVYIQKRAIVPLRASPRNPPDMMVYVAGDFYPWEDGWTYFAGANTEDLTGHIPGSNLARFVTIYVDGDTNELGCVDGEPRPIVYPLGIDSIAPPPPGSAPVCAIHLYAGMTAIEEEDIYDLRIFIGLYAAPPAQHGLDPQHGRHSGRLDTQHLWASVACCGAQ